MTDLQKNVDANKGAPESWCILPWSHVSVKGDGSYRVCCHSNSSPSRGFLKDDKGSNLHVSSASWEEVVNNPTMKRIRKSMLEGKWEPECIRCQRECESGMKSRNLYERYSLAKEVEHEYYSSYTKAQELTLPDGSIKNEDFPVSFLDIRFGNLCNLKCVMCGPTDSDQWYDDYEAVWKEGFFYDSGRKISLEKNSKGKLKPTENIYEWDKDPNLWHEINTHMSQFRRIYIVGGEPLVIDAHYDFLQKCVDAGYAKNLTIEYNSNITNIPARAWNIWKHFRKILIGASIDGYGEVNDLIRFPSKWHKIEENLKKFETAEGNFDVHITTTVQVLNIWHLPYFIEYLLESNFKNIGPWDGMPLLSPHPAHRPPFLNINILPDEFKQEIIKHFENFQTKFRNTDYEQKLGPSSRSTWDNKVKHACAVLDGYKQYLYKVDYGDVELAKHREKFNHLLDTLDTRRGTNWQTTCPELAEATKEWRSDRTQ